MTKICSICEEIEGLPIVNNSLDIIGHFKMNTIKDVFTTGEPTHTFCQMCVCHHYLFPEITSAMIKSHFAQRDDIKNVLEKDPANPMYLHMKEVSDTVHPKILSYNYINQYFYDKVMFGHKKEVLRISKLIKGNLKKYEKDSLDMLNKVMDSYEDKN